jgi:hypothetical protein
MIAYWLLFFMFAIGAITSGAPQPVWPVPTGATPPNHRETSWPGKAVPLFLACILTATMIGFRYKVGADWDSYLIIYDVIERLGITKALLRWEPGYTLLNLLGQRLDVGIWFVNLICGLLFMHGLMQFARRQPNPWLATLVAVPYLIIGVGMGYTRQSVAIGCCMAGFAALSKGSFKRMAIWVLVGAMFHRTAVLVLPLAAMSYTKSRWQTLAVLLVGGYVAYKVLFSDIEVLQNLYIRRGYESQGAAVRLLMNLPPSILFMFNSRRFGLSEAERKLWRNIAFVAILSAMFWVIAPSTAALDRLALYLIPIQIVVLARMPNLLTRSHSPSAEYKYLIVVYCAVVQFVWLNFANHADYWIPYAVYPFG